MWFKNIRVFRLAEAFTLTPEALSEALEPTRFTPCGKMDVSRYGWVSPLGPEGQMLTHSTNGCIAIAAKKQEKILPASVIKEQLDEKVRAIRAAEGRPVGRKERDGMKDEIIFTLLPQAFTKSSTDFAYLDTRNDWVVVNAASASRAEDLLSALREALGSLRAVPLTPKDPAIQVMTHWVREQEPATDFALGEECELNASSDDRVIRCKNLDLHDEQIGQHINTGMYVNKLAVQWQENIHCVIDDQFTFKRIKFADELLERAGDRSPESLAEQFDAEFAIMTLELAAFIKSAIAAFGGEDPSAIGSLEH
jgi:recombination associated protein RdgC